MYVLYSNYYMYVKLILGGSVIAETQNDLEASRHQNHSAVVENNDSIDDSEMLESISEQGICSCR